MCRAVIPHASSGVFMVFLRLLSLVAIYHERAQAALPPQYRGLDFAALNAFHSSCLSQGTTDGQTDMQSR